MLSISRLPRRRSRAGAGLLLTREIGGDDEANGVVAALSELNKSSDMPLAAMRSRRRRSDAERAHIQAGTGAGTRRLLRASSCPSEGRFAGATRCTSMGFVRGGSIRGEASHHAGGGISSTQTYSGRLPLYLTGRMWLSSASTSVHNCAPRCSTARASRVVSPTSTA